MCRDWHTLKLALQCPVNTVELLGQRKSHIDHVSTKLREYYRMRDNAILDQTNYCSINVYGADQSICGLPHLASQKENELTYFLEARLIGKFEPRQGNYLHFLKISNEQEMWSNQDIEDSHIFLHSWSEFAPFPPRIFAQMDIFACMNKTWFMFA